MAALLEAHALLCKEGYALPGGDVHFMEAYTVWFAFMSHHHRHNHIYIPDDFPVAACRRLILDSWIKVIGLGWSHDNHWTEMANFFLDYGWCWDLLFEVMSRYFPQVYFSQKDGWFCLPEEYRNLVFLPERDLSPRDAIDMQQSMVGAFMEAFNCYLTDPDFLLGHPDWFGSCLANNTSLSHDDVSQNYNTQVLALEKTPEELEAVENLKSRASAFAKAKNKKEPVFKPPFGKSPMALPPGDDRFNHVKKKRVYACDGCGELVGFSSGNQGAKDFLGSYADQSWKNLEMILQREAYELGLIDARWFCEKVCGAQPTGDSKKKRPPLPKARKLWSTGYGSHRSRSPRRCW